MFALFVAESVVVPPIVISPFGKLLMLIELMVQVPPPLTITDLLTTPLGVPEILKETLALGSPVPETVNVSPTSLCAAGEVITVGATVASLFKVTGREPPLFPVPSVAVAVIVNVPSANPETSKTKFQVPTGDTATVGETTVLPAESVTVTDTLDPASANPSTVKDAARAEEMTNWFVDGLKMTTVTSESLVMKTVFETAVLPEVSVAVAMILIAPDAREATLAEVDHNPSLPTVTVAVLTDAEVLSTRVTETLAPGSPVPEIGRLFWLAWLMKLLLTGELIVTKVALSLVIVMLVSIVVSKLSTRDAVIVI